MIVALARRCRALFLVLTVLLPTVVALAPAAAAQSCPQAELIFARGRIEPAGAGQIGSALISALRQKTGMDIDLYSVNYPADTEIDIGANDTCFKVDTAMACYRQVEKIYKAAGASDLLELDLHPGEHGWGGNLSEAFFRRNLDF